MKENFPCKFVNFLEDVGVNLDLEDCKIEGDEYTHKIENDYLF